MLALIPIYLEGFCISINPTLDHAQLFSLRKKAVQVALYVNVSLIVLKGVMGVLSHSMSILSDGLHSSLDLFSTFLSYFTVQISIQPPDESHPFGHGKIETLSSLFEGIALLIAAGFIGYEGMHGLFHPHTVQYPAVGIGVMLLSALVTMGTYHYILKISVQTDSSALQMNAFHFLTDAITSGSILLGLIFVYVLQWYWVDPLMACGVGLYILRISFPQVKKALFELSDSPLPKNEIEQVQSVLDRWKKGVVDIHTLKTRKSGITRYLDFHLVVCKQFTVEYAHQVCNDIKKEILICFPHAAISIHLEPCYRLNAGCQETCVSYQTHRSVLPILPASKT